MALLYSNGSRRGETHLRLQAGYILYSLGVIHLKYFIDLSKLRYLTYFHSRMEMEAWHDYLHPYLS